MTIQHKVDFDSNGRHYSRSQSAGLLRLSFSFGEEK